MLCRGCLQKIKEPWLNLDKTEKIWWCPQCGTVGCQIGNDTEWEVPKGGVECV